MRADQIRGTLINIQLKDSPSRLIHFLLCQFEPRLLTLGEEHSLRVFENRVLKKKTWAKMEEVMKAGKFSE